MDTRELGHKARQFVLAEMKNKDWEGVQWGEGVQLAEMVGTDAGAAQELLEKVTYDFYQGRENVELVYAQIFNKLSDPNLPQTMTVKELAGLTGAFLQHVEGGEVTFGSIKKGGETTAQVLSWTLGFQFTKEFIIFNQTWRATEVSEAMGEAYNKLLNHLHLGPITTYSGYTTTGGDLKAQKDAQKAGTPQRITFDTTGATRREKIANTLRNALRVLPKGTHFLANSWDVEEVYDAIKGDFVPVTEGAISTTPTKLNRRFSEDSFITYDGSVAEMGDRKFEYAGVPQGKLFFLLPKAKNFRELEKQDLEVNTGNADVSRLVLDQIVGDTFRGVYCALGGEEGVVQVDLS